jgi:hypothetical protein
MTAVLINHALYASKDSLPNFKARKFFLTGSTGILSAGSIAYLGHVWYSKYNTSSFHDFDDSKEWLQMDKVGHTLTNFQMSHLMMKSFDWAGFSRKKSIWIGGTIGFSYMTIVEVMDGFSKGWGFSITDMGCNALGTAIAMTQHAAWNEQRFNLKFSVHTTSYPQYNPDLLGDDFGSKLLKDYNGQTYWLSVSPFCFIKSDRKLPKWLAISFGYGADGMLGAFYNNVAVVDEQGNVTEFQRQRQYYLSLDVDLSKIKTKNKYLKAVFNAFNILKIPAPTLEFQNGKTNFHYLYF